MVIICMVILGKNKDILNRMDIQNFQIAKISKKKIINDELCIIDFKLDNWDGHIPGQYSEICLTSEDGYEAIRPYSIASEPNKKTLSFLLEKIPNGEVSTFFYDFALVGDLVKISKPIGQRFILKDHSYTIMIASGSGIAPFLSMSKFLLNNNKTFSLFHWSKYFSGLVDYDYFSKKKNEANYFPFVTREKQKKWTAGNSRISAENFINFNKNKKYEIYICGSDSFVEKASEIIDDSNLNFKLYTERFGS